MPEDRDQPSKRTVVRLEDAAKQRDDAYRAIGRYTVLFSALVGSMREILGAQIGGPWLAPERTLIRLAFGGLQAQQIADPFFAMCRNVTDFDGTERAIERCVRERVNEEIRQRNRIAHGDWLVPRWKQPGLEWGAPALMRAKASRVQEPFVQENLAVSRIDAMCDGVEHLERIVWEFGTICTGEDAYTGVVHPQRRVREALAIKDGQVVFRTPEKP